MGDQSTQGSAEQDDRLQMAVLGHLLLAYPASFALGEVVTALVDPFDESFSERDGIRRAVRDLVCAGLLRSSGDCVVPTQATARFAALAGL